MPHVIEFSVDGGGTVRVEAAHHEATGRAAGPAEVVTVARQSLQQALDPLRPLVAGVLEKLRDLPRAPDRIDVEFGVKLSSEVGVIVARGTAEANFTVRLEWERPAKPGV